MHPQKRSPGTTGIVRGADRKSAGIASSARIQSYHKQRPRVERKTSEHVTRLQSEMAERGVIPTPLALLAFALDSGVDERTAARIYRAAVRLT